MDHNINNAYYEALLLKKIREGNEDDEGEGQFGLIPLSTDPNHLLNKTTQNIAHGSLGPRPHPLLSKSQQFSGIDRRISANPQENSTAQELYPQLQHKHQLRLQQKQKKIPPRLTPR